MAQYVTTRQYATRARQYEVGEPVDGANLGDDERISGVADGSLVPPRWVGTAAQLAARGGVPGPGVLVYETDTGVARIGDGSTSVAAGLPAFGGGATLAPAGSATNSSASLYDVNGATPAPSYPPALLIPPAGLFAASAAAAWYTANAATFMRFQLPGPRTYRYVNLNVGVSSGSIQVGVCRVRQRAGDVTQVDMVRVVDSGVIACPTAGTARIDLGYFTLAPGDYALFLWCDNTTATFTHSLASGYTAYRSMFSTTGLASGVGATVFTSGVTTRWVSGMGLESAPFATCNLGDSITASDGVLGSATSWWTNMDAATGYRFYLSTNNGVPGERSDQILARAAAAFSGKRYATILAGTNDVGQGVAAPTVIANLTAIYDAAVTAGLTGFMVGTIPPRTESGSTPLSAAKAEVLRTVNAWIRSNYASWAGAVLADWTWALSDGTSETAPLASNFSDGTHPTTPGTAIMSRVAEKAVRGWV